MNQVPLKLPRVWWLTIPLAYVLYFHGMATMGMLGPDEPRYAAIGRAMAASGDWVTPRLWGQPWFEKPALLYWMTASAFRLGLGPDIAPRLPVALLSLAFLIFFYWILRREFGDAVAWYGALILATCGGWIAFSAVGVTDLPLTACFSAAMLLALPWVRGGDARWLPAASAMLGFAVLAKGLVPLVLAAPLLAFALPRWRDLLHPRAWLPCVLVATPWYWLCWVTNGQPFIQKFFVEHHFSRFTSSTLLHGQSWWFYFPVLAGAVLPWFPLAPLWARRDIASDVRVKFLSSWLVFGFVFFSASTNKLPGYLMPLVPAAAALSAIGLSRCRDARLPLAACALLLVALPVAVQVLPAAVAAGLSRAPCPVFHWTWLAPLAIAAGALALEARRQRPAAVLLIAMGAGAGVLYLKQTAGPVIDRTASARPLWREIAGRRAEVCLDDLHRNWLYGLNYYAVTPLPDCDREPRRLRIEQVPGQMPVVRPGLDPPSSGVIRSHFRY